MYNIPEYKPKIYLVQKNGINIEYIDWDYFIDSINENFARRYIVDSFKKIVLFKNFFISKFLHEKFIRVRESDYYTHVYIVRDEFGSYITKSDVIHAVQKHKYKESLKNPWFLEKQRCKYRFDPIPNCRKSKCNYFGIWYKKPRTTQEMRWNLAHKEFVRGKRKKPNLPNSWDDKLRGDVRERKNWKKRRGTQWKNKTHDIKKYFEYVYDLEEEN